MKLKMEGLEPALDAVTKMLNMLVMAIVGLAVSILALAVQNAH
jgi:hypothetical protein